MTVDEAQCRVPPGKPTELLVRLALDAGVEVRTDRLIDDLWGDDAAARNTLQSKVSILRRALGASVPILGSRTGYTLDVDPRAVDAIDVLALLEVAERAMTGDDHRTAFATAVDALGHFHGDVLSEAGDGAWLQPYRARLDEARLALLECKLGAAIEIAAPGAAIGELEDLVRQHPLRERLWELLIWALYRAQRQADALDAYRRIRDLLDTELGLSPGPRLAALEQRVLQQDPVLDPVKRTVAGAPVPRRGNVPSLMSQLVGRDDELASVTDLLSVQRLVTIVGPAGVGKTRLATEAARVGETTDAWLVRLEAAHSPSQLPSVVGDALGLNGATVPMIVDRLLATTSVVVLDNCEHLVEAVAELTSTLLDRVPGISILATSQVPLDLDGETVLVLAPLPIEASIELFTQRSVERRRSFTLDPDAAVVVESLCRSLDGLPLAIELAAARTKALSVQEIARRLDDRFSLLNDPSARRPERHRALSTAIAWSYDLLFPDEKQVLWAVGCFTDGAPLAGVEAVTDALGVPGPAAVDALGRLADRSLVAVEVGAEGSVRYRLLNSVRAFTADRVADAGMTTTARAAHAAWFADRADDARRDERGPRQVPHLVFARTERANIDAALAWSASNDPTLGLRITRGFGWGWIILGEAHVAAERTRAVLVAAEAFASPADRAIALSQITWNEAGADLALARTAGEDAVAAAELSQSATAIAESRLPLAFVLLQAGQPGDAIAMLRQWRADAGDHATAWETGVSCMLLGYSGLVSGDAALAHDAATEGITLHPQVGDGWLVSHFESILGQLALAEGDVARATAHLSRAAQAAQQTELLATEAYHLVALGRVQQLAGQLADAAATLQAAIDSAQAVGLMRVVALAQVQLGRVLIRLDEPAQARAVLSAVGAWFAASGGGEDAALATCLLATLPDEATNAVSTQRLATLLDSARTDSNVEIQVLCLDALARASARAGDGATAQRFLAEADELAPSATHRVASVDRIDAAVARALLPPTD